LEAWEDEEDEDAEGEEGDEGDEDEDDDEEAARDPDPLSWRAWRDGTPKGSAGIEFFLLIG
jgi:hypothetical protein